MIRPKFTADEWQIVDRIICKYGSETNDVADILDDAINDLLDDGVTDDFVLAKPGEVFEAIYYRIWCRKYGPDNFEQEVMDKV